MVVALVVGAHQGGVGPVMPAPEVSEANVAAVIGAKVFPTKRFTVEIGALNRR